MISRPDFNLLNQSTNITADIEDHLIELRYTDHLEGQSDELTITFEDKDGKWIREWFPTQGDALNCAIGYKGAQLADIGSFEIDTLEMQSPPTVITLQALSTGVSKRNRTLQAKAYDNTTLANVVSTVANRLKMKVVGTIKDIPIQRVTQYQERDIEFLSRIARNYNHAFKVVNNQLVFTYKSDLKAQKAVRTIDYTQTLSITLKDRIKDVAKTVEVKGFNADSKSVIQQSKNATSKRQKISQSATSASDTLKIVTRGESQEQIDARTDSALSEQEDEQQAGSISMIGDTSLVAGAVLKIVDMGVFSGNYLIKQSTHTITRADGYITDLEVRMISFIADDLSTQSMEAMNDA